MNKNVLNSYFPVLLNLSDARCLVIGGGEIAFHKINSMLKFNTEITILSPDIHEKVEELIKNNRVKHIKDYYSPKYLADINIVVSATNNKQVNKEIKADCKSKGILLNVVDDPELCDFILPANIQRGDLTVSIATQGKAPFYTRHFRAKLESLIPEIEAEILELAAQYRRKVFSDPYFSDMDKKRAAFRMFTDVNWEEEIDQNGSAGAVKIMDELLEKIKNNID